MATGLVGGAVKIVGSSLHHQDKEIEVIRDDVKVIQAASVATNISVARIEGFMAATNGKQRQLPDTDASKQIAQVVKDAEKPTDVADVTH